MSSELRILLVEDNSDYAVVLGKILKKAAHFPFTIHRAGQLCDALDHIRGGDFDVLLLDLSLPDTDGLETLIRAHAAAPLLPIVVLTGLDDHGIGLQAVQHGAQDYLVKSDATGPVLARALRYAVERKRAEAILRKAREVLEDRVRERTEDLLQANEALRHAQERLEVRVGERTAELARVNEEVHASAARLSAIVNTAASGIITFDDRGIIRLFNPAAEALFRYSAEAVVGQQDIDGLLPGLCEDTPDGVRDVRNAYGELLALRSDRTTFPAEITASALHLDGHNLFTAIVRDITKRRQNEEARKLFLRATSHDVRNALMIMVGYAEILAGEPAEGGPERTEATSRIAGLAETLSAMMNDLADQAGLNENHTPRWTVASAPSLVINCAKDAQAQCRKKGIVFRLEAPDDGPIHTDPEKFTRILHNLLSNAVRYTSEGEIHLRGELTPTDLRLTIRDTGIGIATDNLDRIFEPYYRDDAAQVLEQLGTGLGLAIVKRFCELLGGSVSVQSTPGVGSTFQVRLPRQPPTLE